MHTWVSVLCSWYLQLEQSAALFDTEDSSKDSLHAKAQAADKRSQQHSTSSVIEKISQQQGVLSSLFQGLQTASERRQPILELQQFETEQWDVAEGLLQVHTS